MPKVKIARKNISLDMTAMCDMAFLLLTFFMLATKFKPDEVVTVDTPSSISEIPIPDSDILLIQVDKDGRVFFGVDGQHNRPAMLDRVATVYNVQFTEKEKYEFSIIESFGMPLSSLKQYLNTPVEARSKFKQPGIPCDSLQNELKEWVMNARRVNNKFKIAIKGDEGADYATMKKVIETLQDQNINRFNLVTSIENRPADMPAKKDDEAAQ
ncbi:MAG: biopolymer transporter ExbD [Cytophagales bacterium]|nr:MAG: biopolymer transporter ExbD [Cytophagales bacterium]TAF59786.1 MAG: biopolymer transporter ExbD [Cytophagales bacterium]